jgi:hypothetical protein
VSDILYCAYRWPGGGFCDERAMARVRFLDGYEAPVCQGHRDLYADYLRDQRERSGVKEIVSLVRPAGGRVR